MSKGDQAGIEEDGRISKCSMKLTPRNQRDV
jgi:hypothetical protein